MFGRRYFGARYFGPRYFGESDGAAPVVKSGDVLPWWLIQPATGQRIGIALGRDVELFIEFEPGLAKGIARRVRKSARASIAAKATGRPFICYSAVRRGICTAGAVARTLPTQNAVAKCDTAKLSAGASVQPLPLPNAHSGLHTDKLSAGASVRHTPLPGTDGRFIGGPISGACSARGDALDSVVQITSGRTSGSATAFDLPSCKATMGIVAGSASGSAARPKPDFVQIDNEFLMLLAA